MQAHMYALHKQHLTKDREEFEDCFIFNFDEEAPTLEPISLEL